MLDGDRICRDYARHTRPLICVALELADVCRCEI